ncbi:F0F1 ATP synthase subunit delta [bacterium]|nr:F0F1 ATP synthase subunit delta [bacterium]
MLDFDWVTILAEVINFLVLAVALYFLLFKPTVKRIKARNEEREALLQEAARQEAEAAEKLAEINSRLAEFDAEIEGRLQEAYQQAQTDSETLLEATREEARRILEEAEQEAGKRQQQEINQLQEELVDSILDISGQVLSKAAPDLVHDTFIEDLTKEIWELGKSDMRQVNAIRDSLAERTPTVFVTAARELTPDQQRNLIRTFSALADRNVNMEIEIDPNLISGIRVRMGDLVVENTLTMELSDLKSDVAASLQESFNGE